MAWLECGECRGCPASSWHIRRCIDRNEEEMERQMVDAMVARHEMESYFAQKEIGD